MTRSRVVLAFILAAPALLLAGVVMVTSLAILLSQPEGDTDAGLARVGDDLALVVVVEEAVGDGIVDSGLLAPALALIPALCVTWWVAGKVKRVVADARAEIVTAPLQPLVGAIRDLANPPNSQIPAAPDGSVTTPGD